MKIRYFLLFLCVFQTSLFAKEIKNNQGEYQGEISKCENGDYKSCLFLAKEMKTKSINASSSFIDNSDCYREYDLDRIKACEAKAKKKKISQDGNAKAYLKKSEKYLQKAKEICKVTNENEACFQVNKYMFGYENTMTDEIAAEFDRLCKNSDKAACSLMGIFYDTQKYRELCGGIYNSHYNSCYIDYYDLNAHIHDYEAVITKAKFNQDRIDRFNVEVINYLPVLDYYKRACDLNNYASCVNLGRLYANGLGTRLNYPKALELYKLACENKDGVGCRKLASLAEDFPNLGISKQDFTEYYGIGCDLGDQVSCDSYKRLVTNSNNKEN